MSVVANEKMQSADVFDTDSPSDEWAMSLNEPTLYFGIQQLRRAIDELTPQLARYRTQLSLLTKEKVRREQQVREVKQPCLATTHAYDADMACARPLGHDAATPDARGFTWGEGHCPRPLPSDPPVYTVREVTRFEPGWEIALP